MAAASRARLADLEVPAAARQVLDAALGQIAQLDGQLDPIDRWLAAYSRRQPGCKALVANHYGVGRITAPTILAELGDARRFSNREAVVRYTGLDVTVHSSDGKRAPGQLSRQGPGLLRWALFEAATCHARAGAPHHETYRRVKDRIDGNRAGLTVARKLVREIRHTLIELGDQAIAAVDDLPLPQAA